MTERNVPAYSLLRLEMVDGIWGPQLILVDALTGRSVPNVIELEYSQRSIDGPAELLVRFRLGDGEGSLIAHPKVPA